MESLLAVGVGACMAVAGCTGGGEIQSGFVPGPNSPVAVGPEPSGLAAADLNGDGRLDLVMTCGTKGEPHAGRAVVLINEGGGRFVARERWGTEQPVDTLVAADFDGDTRIDVAAVGHDSYRVHLLMGDGKGGLTQGASFAAHAGKRPHTHAVAAADVDGDGDIDLLTGNADDDAVAVLLNDGKGSFSRAPGSPFPTPRHPYTGLVVTDLNGDKRVDVAAALLESGEVGVYLGDGTGRFSPAAGSPYKVAARPGFVHADDLNGDGRPDLMATHDDVGMVDVLLNQGGGSFAPAPGSPVRVREAVWSVVTADFDGDGDRDAVLSTPGRSLVMLAGDGRGGLSRVDGVGLATGKAPNRLVAADLDGDGKVDVATANYESGDVTVLLRR